MTESPDAVTISVPVEACECGGMNGHHEICPVAYAEMIEQYRQVVAERDAAVVRAEGAEVAWTDTITERDEALAAIEQVRVALSNHPRCDRHPDGDPVTCGWKRAVIDVQHALDGGDPQ